MVVGGVSALDYTILPENATNQEVIFTSSKESVVSVTDDGVLYANAIGQAIIVITTEDGNFKADCKVQVSDKAVPVKDFTLDKTELTLQEGEKYFLKPMFTPTAATDQRITWSSDDNNIATVSSSGMVTAVNVGTTVITAVTMDGGISAECIVDVTSDATAVVGKASNISCRNAIIPGQAILPSKLSEDTVFGIAYSHKEENVTSGGARIAAKEFDEDYKFTLCTGVLNPNTTYYYCTFVTVFDKTAYSEIRSFKTLDLSTMIKTEEVTGIQTEQATLNAYLNLSDCAYDELEYGFLVQPESEASYLVKASNLSKNKFSFTASDLKVKHSYSVSAYVRLDNFTYRAESVTFVTQADSE